MENKEKAGQVSVWEKVKIVTTAIMTIIIPILIALIGNWYTQAIKERETQLRYIELSINILSQEPSDKNRNIRSWAINIINEYAPKHLEEETKNELKLKTRLPETQKFYIQQSVK
ncbi:MAG: hypothetical protein JETT_0263 [Candidatus Jettenia ecosi]|uniref:Uncharacterized protein n=1 Tax=Candidatus Jettenia ecosi TaxID=2494326 RepID=A0A533QF97_9BACT|nr:MAG: hypothetical protein JETT_0263 [Candidatus Jettenia ecosi]